MEENEKVITTQRIYVEDVPKIIERYGKPFHVAVRKMWRELRSMDAVREATKPLTIEEYAASER